MYELPEVKKWIEPYESFYSYLSDKTGTNITTPEDVFFLDNLFQTLVSICLQAYICIIGISTIKMYVLGKRWS